MKPAIYTATDTVFRLGLLILCASFTVFCFPFILPANEGLFLVNLLFTAMYFVALLVHGKLRKGRMGLYAMFVFLAIFLVSAYALNREMEVFKTSTGWLSAVLIISCINLILFAYRENISKPVQYLMSFIAGISFVLFGYLAIYLIPLYALSAIGAIFLGISLHSFVPLLFCIYIIVLFSKLEKVSKSYVHFFWTGFAAALVSLLIFLTAWGFTLKALNKTTHADLPGWVAKAQKLRPGPVTEKVLKTDLAYSIPNGDFSNFLWSVPRRNFDEEIKHDPMVMTAALIGGKPAIDDTDKIKILNTIYDVRYNAEERYWSGTDLSTTKVDTQIEIWPDIRIAYTEMQLEVFNSRKKTGWRNDQQEAIYSFYLPEGSVVTSLSLWIEGKEEKAILTTKSKAVTAYKTIVGVEVRDPSVVHRQEGNRVSLRVFPVINEESRLFKIGVSSPLLLSGNQLQYHPVYFDGPPAAHAKEKTGIRFSTPAVYDHIPRGFKKIGGGLEREGNYTANWQLDIPKTDIRRSTFSSQETNYRVQPVGNILETADIQAAYLDINASWTTTEFRNVLTLLRGKTVFVADEAQQIIFLNEENREQVFASLKRNGFSLFPFHKVEDPDHSLVITKSSALSPSLDDLDQTKFLQEMKNCFSDGRRIRLYNIGSELSLYLKTLKEFRCFYYAGGNINRLHELVTTRQFPAQREKENQVIIDAAEIMIEASDIPAEDANGPGHIMRLFVYNNILKNNGVALLTDRSLEDEVLDEAQTAYVVSPVSSLIVLETQKDYERFNIEDSKNGLKNAALQSKGAVPEPHEWALIILVGLLLYVKWKHGFTLKANR
ncbi:MAG: XrtN system VIT domain-containing protein [Chitinophagaceae bacterium]|nr:XrtN system VIT domain-containing protein [Chitinophagaceae bacterium]MCW5928494.1 XrtN system VIT domain-containing protein [Chitinophagaceae bacterium]